jgi:hypothetical protein
MECDLHYRRDSEAAVANRLARIVRVNVDHFEQCEHLVKNRLREFETHRAQQRVKVVKLDDHDAEATQHFERGIQEHLVLGALYIHLHEHLVISGWREPADPGAQSRVLVVNHRTEEFFLE